MYGSYGSYSSMSATSAPMDITPINLRSHDASCAYPSWPRRSSLSDSEHEEPRATSFLSDDDLFLSDPFDDDSHSISSSSTVSSPFATAIESPPRISEEELMRIEREKVAMQREFIRQVKQEKERRRQAALRARRSSPKKSPKNKPACLTTITETAE
ncbi:Membrane protein [Purpureocillium lavendulum]|uniref:Membrane protein n=1 Tax=Purpureocillium lavendulum TaxID=1247861 RepID=A0AB34FQH7_9HYPO|nr:Membrane protein [Purpureocillium lavendulum]